MKSLKIFFVIGALGGLTLISSPAQSWVKSDAPSNIFSFAITASADGTKLAASSYEDDTMSYPGVIYLSTNSGLNWIQSSAPSNYWYAITGNTNGTKLAAVVRAGGIWGSTNSGTTWTNLGAPNASWAAIAASAGAGAGGGSGTLVAVAGGNDRFIYVSTNSGSTWMNAGAPSSQVWISVAASADGTRLIAAGNANTSGKPGAIYTSTNSGATWRSNNITGLNWTGVASSGDGMMLVAVAPNAIYASKDGGGTWALASNKAGYWYAVVSSADGSRLAVATYPAVYTSSDAGTTWVSNSMPQMQWSALATSYDGNRLAAGAGSAGIYTLQSKPRLTFGVTPTNVSLAWPAPSAGFGLEQNTNLATATWVAVTNVPGFTNWQNQVFLSRTNGNHFFRLRSP